MNYIFDFDGTLVDSMPIWSQQFISVLEQNGIKCPDDFVKIITPLGNYGTAEYCTTLGVNMTAEEILEITDANLYEEYAYNIPAKEYVKEALIALKEKGHSLNVLTACPHIRLDVTLKRLGLYELFDNVWSCDDFDFTKSQPQIYTQTAERLGVSVKECIFLDDNFNALAAAKESGMTVFGVYDDTSADYKDQIAAISDKYIYDFRGLLEN
ncbi:MAG: HAD family phosphatase [Clostridia bacterium]|nr:HAD family phosphatase [Clostridia bacterium]